jgi:hypothetical protein
MIEKDGRIMLPDIGYWPKDNQVSSRWDRLFLKYNLLRLEDDPFNRNNLLLRIQEMAANVTDADFGRSAYTVYLTMGNRKFICFLYYGSRNLDEYWSWVYDIK